MIKRYVSFCLLALSVLLTACAFPHIPRAKVTFKVIDCEGKPIANEPLMLGFSPTDGYYDETDEDGYFTGEGRTESDYIFNVGHKSKKYYRTRFQKKMHIGRRNPRMTNGSLGMKPLRLLLKNVKIQFQCMQL